MKVKRPGVELRVVLDSKDELPRKADPALLKALARASRWFEEIVPSRVRSSAEIAQWESLQKDRTAQSFCDREPV